MRPVPEQFGRDRARRIHLRRRLALALCAATLAAGGCLHRRALDPADPAHFRTTIRDLLRRDEPTPAYYEMMSRLEDMGPEVDAVLLALARDRGVNTVVRSNALILLAERRTPGALPALERALATSNATRLRAAAVLGLQKLAPGSPEAVRLIRSAVRDPARAVRLTALQALDIGEVATIREVLDRDRDSEVRAVAMQLVAIAESRGAPLAADRRGALRTTGAGLDPQIVFRPARFDPTTGVSVGDLRVELPATLDLPLTTTAQAVGNVVPAFFSADRAQVVYEDDGEIRVVDLPSRRTRSVGIGTAPRVVPFSNHFVFLREESRQARSGGAVTEVQYDVFRADFAAGDPERIGELRAEARADRGGTSPVRRLVVAETGDGFVLRGEGVSTFPLPARVWGPSPRPGATPR